MGMDEPVISVSLSFDRGEKPCSLVTHGTRNAASDLSKNEVMIPAIN
jgi:hypothetical protein